MTTEVSEPNSVRFRPQTGPSQASLAVWMLAPAILFIVLLIGFPLGLAVYYSLSNVTTGGSQVTLVGFDHFRNLIGDPTFRGALGNTFLFTFGSLVIMLILATIQAELLIRPFRGKWLVRFLILLPWTAPAALAVIGWLWMFDSVFSPIDWLLRQLGLLGQPGAPLGVLPNLYWLGHPTLAFVSVILVNVWRMLPLATVIVLAGLNSIPPELFEQARVDRAGYFRRLFQITLPLLSPILLVAILFAFVFTFSDMIVIYILTRGGPANSTQVLSSLAFFTGIAGGNLGRGAAIALFLFPVLAGVSALLLAMIRRSEVA
ncbi:MAG TPA: sugar ABC transporter permease [Trueperaceae bacterium]